MHLVQLAVMVWRTPRAHFGPRHRFPTAVLSS
uniref:Uncharacterized protein n=1 Tax=Arundo donax TaxID=35708 RepID=A0A0A8YUS3_ARUDO